MRVVIRVDASIRIGTGHVMRCLTLAHMLRGFGATIDFICRDYDGHLCDSIEERGFGIRRLSVADASWQTDATLCCAAMRQLDAPADLLVVDHYGLDGRWERSLRPLVRRIFVIDDLADRVHDCDVLLDQNLHELPGSRYDGLVAGATRVFVGPRYALLRPEFDNVAARLRDQGLRRLMVFLGGVDPTNEAIKLVHALRNLGSAAPPADFVLGPINPHVADVEQAAKGMTGVTIVRTTNEMAKIMSEADLGIGTCGSSAWERCALGLPSLVVVNADNQLEDARILHAMGAVRNLGNSSATTAELWAAQIHVLQNNPAALMSMSRASAAVMQGRKEAARELAAALVN